jgi:hypothetical protein
VSEDSAAAPTVAQVLGQTARALRGDRKVEVVAREARFAGLNWGTGRIADLEAGRVSPTLPTLIALAWTFSKVLGRTAPLPLSELFAGDGNVDLLPSVTVPIELLRKALGGELADPPFPNQLARSVADKRLEEVERSMLEADYRMAHGLGISAESAAAEMAALWGRSFTAERDRRGGPDSSPQKRGRISRELKAELQEATNRGND